MELNTPHIMIGVFFSAFLIFFFTYQGIVQIFTHAEKRKTIRHKIRGDRPAPPLPQQVTQGTEKSNNGRFQTISKWLGTLGGQLSAEESDLDNEKMQRFLRAGIRNENAVAIFHGIKFILITLSLFVFVMSRLTIFKLTNGPATIAIAVLIALGSYYLPDIWLRFKIQRRKELLIKALPDALDLLVVCVEAGMGMDGAIHRVANEIRLNSPALSDELKLLNRQLRAGKSRQDALRDLALRTDLEALTSLSTLLIQTDKFGTSVAAALRVFSDSYRTRRYQKAEEMAAKIPIKLIFPLILFIFPSLFVVILGPAAIRIYQNIIM